MANKKINQLVSKTAILSTDLFGIGDATTGQLFKKTIAELQAAIGGAVISVNGLVGTVVLDTDDIQELASPTNKWFTDARARAAISLTVTGNSGASTYSSGTGVLNVPTYTLAGLGGITASFLSGTSGISYNSTTGVISYSGTVYTDASIRALFSGSTGITYNSSTGAISYSGTVYTDSSVRALISMTTTGNSGASTYNNTTGVINVPEYTLAGLGGISLTSLSGGTGITYNNTTGAISYSGTVYTDASVRALISLTTTGTSGASTYNSTTGVLNIPQYQSALTNPVTGTGTTNYVAKFTSSSAIGNSQIFDNGTSVGIGTASPSSLLDVGGIVTIKSGYFGGGYLKLNYTSSDVISRSWLIANDFSVSGDFGIYQSTTNSGSTYVNKFFISAAGNVGIGTTSPDRALDIYSASVVAIARVRGNTTNGVALTIQNDQNAQAISIYAAGTSGFGLSGWAGNAVLESDTGTVYSANNGNHIFQTASRTERMRITSTGNVGIGTSTPVDAGANYKILTLNGTNSGILRIQVNGTSAGDFESDATNTYLWELRNANLSFGTNSTERMRITSTGNVGISNTSPNDAYDAGSWFTAKGLTIGNDTSTAGLQIVSSSTSTLSAIRFGDGGSSLYDQGFINYNHSTDRMAFGCNRNTTITLTSTNNLLVGTTSDNGERLYVSGAIRATGTITANSDLTLKKNLLKIENALEKVEQINGYTYELKEDDSKRHGGVIAQEIDKVFPEIVNTGNDGLMGVEYGNISALLIEAIKEQNTKIKNLETLLASK